ncbi:MAG: DUF6541 family protein [Candidatus Omnitrophota bacterium]
MPNKREFPWDLYALFIVVVFLLLQIARWRVLPQFLDTYYHLQTAWGFIQAGGYSGWDFWQYAPVGRIHIYPPVFHIILAFLMKLGLSVSILAKFFEAAPPIIFLVSLWIFIRRFYNERLAFFEVLTIGSSFSFYIYLINHITASQALIFGIFAFYQLFKNNILRAGLLLTLCFYTHIGISWFLFLAFIVYGLLNTQCRKKCFVISVVAIILAIPILWKQIAALKFISNFGINMNERHLCQIKIVDYILASVGLFLAFKERDKAFRLFPVLFLASLIFIIYPYRFFSAEGYLPIIFLSALFLYFLSNKINKRYFIILAAVFILIISPTISMSRKEVTKEKVIKLKFGDSALAGMLLARGDSLWHPKEYLNAAEIIRNNSDIKDIVCIGDSSLWMNLASLSGRATTNALLPEIGPAREFDPFQVSKIIVLTQDQDPQIVSRVVDFYKLNKIGENKLFVLYQNHACNTKADVRKASVSFLNIFIIFGLFLACFWQAKKIEKLIKNI